MSRPDPDVEPALKLHASLSLGSAGRHWASERRMALLAAIDKTGSISAGARKIGLSYKAAWDAVDAMNTLAGEALVARSAGGHRGGGARLTTRARSLLALYRSLDQAHQEFLAQLARLAGQHAPDLDLIRHLMAQASTRNKLSGTVESLTPAARHHDVIVRVARGTRIVARISQSAVDEPGLHPGCQVLLFIDADAIVIGLPGLSGRLSARNQLPGTLARIRPQDDGIELDIQLEGGATLTSLITPGSLAQLKLQEGQAVHAIFKATAVTLATQD